MEGHKNGIQPQKYVHTPKHRNCKLLFFHEHRVRIEAGWGCSHESWLNLIECAFSKMARTFLRHIRIASIDELKTRILKGVEEMNQLPVVFRWNKFGIGIA
jgi:hypothetical protein